MKSLALLSVLAALALASCFSPTFPQGQPCSETNRCPGDQVCDLGTHLCGGGGGIDAPTDGPQPDACIPAAEICNGLNDDCDSSIDEGVSSQAPCDGADTDLCLDDVTICDLNGNEVCGSSDDNPELCNALDDDCDSNTDEGLAVGEPCDGADSDVCLEGTNACDADAVVCSDNTDDNVELCNGVDDDCDTNADEGIDLQTDPLNCGSCDRVCTNSYGTVGCTAGTCTPICSDGANDCDGDPVTGCELLDNDPMCDPLAPVQLTVDGDQADSAFTSGVTEALYRVRVRESLGVADVALTARISLVSTVGTEFDLYVYCPSCGATPMTSGDDIVDVGRSDGTGTDRSFDVWVEIRYRDSVPGTPCASWTLTIEGNVMTADRCAG